MRLRPLGLGSRLIPVSKVVVGIIFGVMTVVSDVRRGDFVSLVLVVAHVHASSTINNMWAEAALSLGVSWAGQDDGDVQRIFKISTHKNVGQARRTLHIMASHCSSSRPKLHMDSVQYGLNEIHVGETVRTRAGQNSVIIFTVNVFLSCAFS